MKHEIERLFKADVFDPWRRHARGCGMSSPVMLSPGAPETPKPANGHLGGSK
jgi:hypothetical protein